MVLSFLRAYPPGASGVVANPQRNRLLVIAEFLSKENEPANVLRVAFDADAN